MQIIFLIENKRKFNKNKSKTENDTELKFNEDNKTTEKEHFENKEISGEDTPEVKELKECLNNLETINNKIEAYRAYLENKPLEFNGYKNMTNLHMPSELKKVIFLTQTSKKFVILILNYYKKLVTAVIEDNINEVEYLLEYPEADINMTWVKNIGTYICLNQL